MRSVAVPVALALAIVSLARVALAEPAGAELEEALLPAPASFSVSTTMVLEWRGDNRNGDASDDHFQDGLWRTNLLLDGGETRMSMRIDGEGFVGAPPVPGRSDDVRVERVALELERVVGGGLWSPRVSATLGDFYAQLGQGLVLSVRKIDEIGIDIALRGARADLALLDDRLSLILLGGVTNSVNIELQRLRYTEDPRDPIAGGRLEGRLGPVVAGVHAAGGREADLDPAGTRRTTVNYGGSVEAALGSGALTLEVDGQERSVAGGARLRGLAAYTALTLQVGRITLLGEGKHYDEFEPLLGSTPSYGEGRFVYSQPPTAERVDQELIDNTDVTGGRIRGDLAIGLGSGSTTHASFGLFRNRLAAQWFAHGFGGVDLRSARGSSLLVSAGHRREWNVEGGRLARSIVHGEVDLVFPVGDQLGVHAIGRHETHTEPFGDATTRFHRGNTSLELDLGFRWVLAGGFDWNTQDQRPEVDRRFGFGLVRFRPVDGFIVQFLGGTQRGGIRCIAGACRDQPPFAGARLDVTARL